MANSRRFVVLGGAGTIGRVVVRDLFESHPDNQILIADYNKSAADALAKSFRDRRVQARFINVNQPRYLLELPRLLAGNRVVINCLQYDFNLMVMYAAILASVDYIDLGGLFYWTRKQLRLNRLFRDSGLTAVIGMGCAPGITNVLAAYAASKLDKVRSIKIRVGARDFNPPADELYFPYSPKTILAELKLRPWVFRSGKFKQIPPRTGWELTEFPKPVGKTWTLWTRHSEIATLPLSFKDKGLQHCDFKVSFDPEFVKKVLKCRQFKNSTVPKPPPNDYEISRVIVNGMIVDCHAKAKPEWQASAGDVDTACPASIVAQMIAEEKIGKRGVFPPETTVPIQPFFKELEKRGMKIVSKRH